jgi:hypothetical protein
MGQKAWSTPDRQGQRVEVSDQGTRRIDDYIRAMAEGEPLHRRPGLRLLQSLQKLHGRELALESYHRVYVGQFLENEGRLKGTVSQPGYDFLDPRLDWYALYAAQVFGFRNFDQLGLVERLRLVRLDYVLAQEFDPAPFLGEYERALREITARSNRAVLGALTDGLNFMETRDIDSLVADWLLLGYLANRAWQAEMASQCELDRILAIYNPELLRASAGEFSHRFQQDRAQAQRGAAGRGIVPDHTDGVVESYVPRQGGVQ